VREQSMQELNHLKAMRENIDHLVSEAKKKDIQIEEEEARVMKEKEVAVQKY
jgi:hypothetical protein